MIGLPTAGGAVHQLDTLAIDRALNMLADTARFAQLQEHNRWLRMGTTALGQVGFTTSRKNSGQFVIDVTDLLWRCGQNGAKQLEFPRQIVPDLLALIYMQHGHAGVVATLWFAEGTLSLAKYCSRYQGARAIVRLPSPEEMLQ